MSGLFKQSKLVTSRVCLGQLNILASEKAASPFWLISYFGLFATNTSTSKSGKQLPATLTATIGQQMYMP